MWRLPSLPVTDIDRRDLDRDLASAVTSEQALVAHLRSLDPPDPAAPSLLPDWTIGHLLTHIARNADGHLSMLSGRPQYPQGPEGRNADIETGATRAWADLVDDVEITSRSLVARWGDVDDWEGTAATLGGERPRHLLPFLRQREVEVHRADLGVGYGFSDMPSDYLRRELRMMGMLWKARKPMGMTPLPEAALAAPPPTRLAWMMGRTEIDGLAPAGLF
jgi:maleylpyruvate isomerase